jgi:peptidoglycan/LPS O-acetylase OafA/YrhL
MGLFRFALSLIVVMFHFGGYPPLAGRVSVFSFFCISGYLMALVIERAYGTSLQGAGRFYLNRTLRLVPLFTLYVVLTMLLLRARGDAGFFVDPAEPLWLGVGRTGWLDTGMSLDLRWSENLPTLIPSISIAPQAWSLMIEACFYVCAPLLALLWKRARVVFVAIAALSAAMHVYTLAKGLPFARYVYDNFFGTLCIFQLGMTLYYLRDRLVGRLPYKRALALALFAVYWIIVVRMPRVDLENGFYVSLAASVALIALLGSITTWPLWFKRVDKYAGDLAYGIFINHFFAALLLLELNEVIFERRGSFDFFGRINQPLFGHWTVLASIALAAITFVLLERPLQRSRDRVRGVMISPAPELPLIEEPSPAPQPVRA